MNKIKRTCSGLVLLWLALQPPLWPRQEKTAVSLTLNDCIARAVKNNLGVAVQVYGPELADAAVRRATEKFIPQLSFEYNRQDTNSPSYSWINAAVQMQESYLNYSASLGQSLPTGGKLTLSLSAYKNDTNASFQTINPRYGSTLSFNFTQPLLRGFGFKASRLEILMAVNNKIISENSFKSTLLQSIYDVEQAYWTLVYSIETLKVKEQSLELARNLLEQNRKEIAIGTLAPKEILSSQAEVAQRETDILQARALVKDSLDALRTLINIPEEEGDVEIVPVDKPAFEKKDIKLGEAMAAARANRPDLQSQRFEVKNKELDLSYARNQLLPGLNLNANYWSPGISGTRILYLGNNPLTGVIVGTVPSGASNAVRDALNFRYRNWSVSLTLDIPLSDVFSRAQAAQAVLGRDQAAIRLKFLDQQAALEIKMAVRAVETDYQRVESSRIASDLAQKKLQAEESKLRAGLSSNFFILQYQRDLAASRAVELRAIIDYNLSLARLEKAMGTSLESKNIKLTGQD